MIHRACVCIIVLVGLCGSAVAQTAPASGPTSRLATEPLDGPVVRLPAGVDQVTLKLVRSGSSAFVHATIDGREPGWFIIDTGASCSMIDETTASKLHLRVLNGMQMQAAGNIHAAVQAVAVRSLALTSAAAAAGQVVMNGGFIVSKDLQAVSAVEGIPIAGVIGNDILSMPFALDFRDDTITFYARDHFSPPSTRPCEIRMNNQTPLVTGQFEGHQGWFLLDTGDSGRLEVQGVALTMHERITSSRKLITGSSFGAGGSVQSYHTWAKSFRALGHEWQDVWTTLGLGNADANLADITRSGSIGAGALEDARLTGDYRRNRIWVEWRDREPAKQRVARLRERAAHDLNGATALMMAAEEGRADVLEMLLNENDKDINAADSMGFTAVIYEKDDPACLRLLIKHGADVNAQAAYVGRTALLGAAERGDIEAIKILLAAGAKPNLASTLGQTPLLRAVEAQEPRAVRLLLEAGADPSIAMKIGPTPLFMAASNGDEDIAQALLEHKADVNQVVGNGHAPLLQAAGQGRTGMVRLLLAHGAEIAPRFAGETALHEAAMADDAESIQLLLKAGADLNAKNREGKTALQVAKGGAGYAIRALLLAEKGGK